VHPEQPLGFYNSLVKIDTQSGKNSYWRQDGCFPGEPCFVPRPGSKNDEDGILLSIVLDTLQGNSFLLVLDAASLQEIARATVPEPVVFGFHAEFFPFGSHR
jgi:carotenoid cleavage dioxygenase-like enzyme